MRRRGFSLIEVIVVLVVAAIIAAMAIPYFSDAESKASWYHEQVKSGVRYAQRQAVAQRRCVFVSVGANDVSLFYGNGACAITGTPVREVATGNPYVLAKPGAVTITPPTPANFSFNGLGQPSSAVSFSVGAGSITVEPETGYVR